MKCSAYVILFNICNKSVKYDNTHLTDEETGTPRVSVI